MESACLVWDFSLSGWVDGRWSCVTVGILEGMGGGYSMRCEGLFLGFDGEDSFIYFDDGAGR